MTEPLGGQAPALLIPRPIPLFQKLNSVHMWPRGKGLSSSTAPLLRADALPWAWQAENTRVLQLLSQPVGQQCQVR